MSRKQRNGGQGSPRKRREKKKRTDGSIPTYSLYLHERDAEQIKSLVTKAGLLIEATLPYGACTAGDMDLLRDFSNLAAALADPAFGQTPSVRDYCREHEEELGSYMRSFLSFYNRTLGGSFTCTGPEMNDLRDGFICVSHIILQELEAEPAQVVRVFLGLKRFLHENVSLVHPDSNPLERRMAAIRDTRLAVR